VRKGVNEPPRRKRRGINNEERERPSRHAAGNAPVAIQSEQKTRLFFIDNLRIGLIALVVAHHAGQAYGPTGGWWYFTEPARAPVLGTFFVINRSFFMSLFFMLSGYFLPQSFDRKTHGFLKDRFVRLGIPLAVFALVIIPVMMYVYHLAYGPSGLGSFWSYYSRFYFGHGPRPAGWNGPGWPDLNFGHLWFVEHLLLFAVCYWVVRRVLFSRTPGNTGEGRFPRSIEIITFAILLAAVTFVVRLWYPIDRWIAFLGFIQVAFADVPRDLAFFVIGVVAFRRGWFTSLPKRVGMTWLIIGIGASVVYCAFSFAGYAFFQRGGLSLLAFGYDLWEAFLCCGLCIGLTVFFREKVNHQGRFAKDLGASTYGAYLVHVPVLMALQYALGRAVLGPLTKFLVVTIIGILVSFAVASALRRAPLVKSVL
jgi:glucans biosynthesis protein C